MPALVEALLFWRIWWHSAQMCPFALLSPHTPPDWVVMTVPTGIDWSRCTLSAVPMLCGVWQAKQPMGCGLRMMSCVSGVLGVVEGLPTCARGSQENLME